jgi:hypothetical protein
VDHTLQEFLTPEEKYEAVEQVINSGCDKSDRI